MGIFKHLQNEIDEREQREGISIAELLDLSPPLRRLMNRITRRGELSLADAAAELDQPLEETQNMLTSLVEKGYLLREKQESDWIYRTHFARKRGTSLPPGIWSALSPQNKTKEADESGDK